MNQLQSYVASAALPVSRQEAFAYHARPGALARLIPPWESAQIEHSDQSLEVGSRVVLKTKIAGVPLRWVAEHTDYDPPRLFADRQVSGPFETWIHRHEFSGEGDRSTLRDSIQYRLPLGSAGQLLGSTMARTTIERMFAYRHRLTSDDLTLHADRPSQPMTIAISGSSGLVGSQLAALVTLLGHRVRPIVRSPSDDPNAIAAWHSEAEAAKLAEVDAVVHLAGKSIADSRWTDEVKQQIRDSRVIKTQQLCESLARLTSKPAVLVCASAVGIYGNRGDEELDETSAVGDDFLAQVATEWEASCQSARDAGIRVVNARLGMVISPSGGALQKMLLPARLAGGALGNGAQWWSWIALDDVVGAIYHALTDNTLAGPVNFVAPQPLRNKTFAKTLGEVIGRPALFPAPAFALRMALGEMADALLLASTQVKPQRLIEANYRYRFTDLNELLRYCLGYERLESETVN